MQTVANQSWQFNPATGHYYRTGGNKANGAGGIYVLDALTGKEALVAGDTDEGRAACLPNGNCYVVYKAGHSDPAIRFSVYAQMLDPMLNPLTPVRDFGGAMATLFGTAHTMVAPDIAADKEGNIFVAVESLNHNVLVFRFSAAANRWDKVFQAGDGNGTQPNPKLIAAPGGTLHVVYRRAVASGVADLFHATIQGDTITTLGNITSFNGAWDVKAPSLAVLADGTAFAAYVAPPVASGLPARVGLVKLVSGYPKNENGVPVDWTSLAAIALTASATKLYLAVATDYGVKDWESADMGVSWYKRDYYPLPGGAIQVANCYGVSDGMYWLGWLDANRQNDYKGLRIENWPPLPPPAEIKPIGGVLVIDGVEWALEGTLKRL